MGLRLKSAVGRFDVYWVYGGYNVSFELCV